MTRGQEVLSRFYPGETGTILLARPDGWLVVAWSGEPKIRVFLRDYAVQLKEIS